MSLYYFFFLLINWCKTKQMYSKNRTVLKTNAYCVNLLHPLVKAKLSDIIFKLFVLTNPLKFYCYYFVSFSSAQMSVSIYYLNKWLLFLWIFAEKPGCPANFISWKVFFYTTHCFCPLKCGMMPINFNIINNQFGLFPLLSIFLIWFVSSSHIILTYAWHSCPLVSRPQVNGHGQIAQRRKTCI